MTKIINYVEVNHKKIPANLLFIWQSGFGGDVNIQ
jgi:hypothetical protein